MANNNTLTVQDMLDKRDARKAGRKDKADAREVALQNVKKGTDTRRKARSEKNPALKRREERRQIRIDLKDPKIQAKLQAEEDKMKEDNQQYEAEFVKYQDYYEGINRLPKNERDIIMEGFMAEARDIVDGKYERKLNAVRDATSMELRQLNETHKFASDREFSDIEQSIRKMDISAAQALSGNVGELAKRGRLDKGSLLKAAQIAVAGRQEGEKNLERIRGLNEKARALETKQKVESTAFQDKQTTEDLLDERDVARGEQKEELVQDESELQHEADSPVAGILFPKKTAEMINKARDPETVAQATGDILSTRTQAQPMMQGGKRISRRAAASMQTANPRLPRTAKQTSKRILTNPSLNAK